MNGKYIVLRNLLEHFTDEEALSDGASAIGKEERENALQALSKEGYLLQEGNKTSFLLTDKAEEFAMENMVDSALILAAGFGSRFVPLTYECPKGLLEVFSERMIERQIKQLHKVGIKEITIVVGYLKEKFEYLIDLYGVKLLYNPEFAEKNTLATLYHAREAVKGKNFYILSSDNWMRENLYHSIEPYSWYAASFMEGETKEWALTVSETGRILDVQVGGKDAYCMYGPVFFKKEFFSAFLPFLEEYYHRPGTENYYWEDVLMRELGNLPPIYANCQKEQVVYEFENLEELRRFDEKYVNRSGSEAMELISRVFQVPEADITDIRCLKAGMTNKSFFFRLAPGSVNAQYRGQSFICRIPGKGTEELINRREEGSVYRLVEDLGITEELVYFNEENGYKISRYYEGARNADFSKKEDRIPAMGLLKCLHKSGKICDHAFSLRERLSYYEKLCLEKGEIPYYDYESIQKKRDALLSFVEEKKRPLCLCHIDAVQDNFLFTEEGVKMIDWEYAGMADPLLDIAMAGIYAYFSFAECETLLKEYQEGEMPPESMQWNADKEEEMRCILEAYMGLSGLLWSLWSVYKMAMGEQFGDYSLKMLRYFKEAYKDLQRRNALRNVKEK